MRAAASEAAKATAAAAEQKQAAERALEQQRDKAEALTRDLASVQAELDRMQAAASEAAKATSAAAEQKQAAERALQQQRDRAEVLARDLASVQAERDTMQATASEAVKASAAAAAQKQAAERALEQQREAVNRSSPRHGSRSRSVRRASLPLTPRSCGSRRQADTAAEQELALSSARTRSDVLERELASVRDQLDTASRQVAASNSFRAAPSCEGVAVSLHKPMADPSSRITEGKGRSPEQTPVQAAVSNSERSSASELPPQERSTARETVGQLDPKVTVVSERSTPAGDAPRSPVDEQRLLARAVALLRAGRYQRCAAIA